MNNNPQDDDRLFELLALQPEDREADRAPSRLKSKVYTSLVRKQQESGPLRILAETQASGYGLCVFEGLWERVTSAEAAQSFNCCSVCHARVLAEHMDAAPVYWGHCPYVAFGKK